MIWLPVVLAAGLVATSGGEIPVRLAPIACPSLSDAQVRAALRVEIRDRLAPEVAPAPSEFALVSVACIGDNVELLIVRQGGGAPVRREVPLAAVAANARPRALAIAIAELLRVDLVRNAPHPTEQPSPSAPMPPPPKIKIAVQAGGSFGGYVSGPNPSLFGGFQFRAAVESPTGPMANRAWGLGFALTFEDDGPSQDTRSGVWGGASALLRRQPDPDVSYQAALGARYGSVGIPESPPSTLSSRTGGPFGSLGVDVGWYRGSYTYFAISGGYDLGTLGGGWASVLIGGGFRL